MTLHEKFGEPTELVQKPAQPVAIVDRCRAVAVAPGHPPIPQLAVLVFLND